MRSIISSRSWLMLFALLLCAVPVCPAQQTLSEFLKGKAIPETRVQPEDLARQATGTDETDTPDCHWVTTYVLDKTKPPASSVSEYFYAFRQNKASGRWTTAKLTWPVLKISEQPGDIAPRVSACQGGTITRIETAGEFVYFHGHINPSAGCTMVATRDLKFHDILYGWTVGQFKDGRIVYQHSGVHWAPTHYVELSIYDPTHKTKRALYPMKPYRNLRTAYIAQVKAVYDRCCPKIMPDNTVATPGGDCSPRFGNHHCNPELFDSYLKGNLAVSDDSDALAFATVFDDETREHPEVIYIFRHVFNPEKMEYREFLARDLNVRFGDRSLSDYLQPKFLSELFTLTAGK